MSRTMTSGFSCSAAATSARPSDTWPTMSHSAASSFSNAAEQERVIVCEQDSRPRHTTLLYPSPRSEPGRQAGCDSS